MRRFPVIAASAALALSPLSAWAEPATSEGARGLEALYATYLSRAAIDDGVISIAPDNDAYVVTWDFQKLAGLAGLQGLKVEPFSYRLTPGPAGAWTLLGDHYPHVSMDIPAPQGRATATLDFQGVRLGAVFDPQQTEFLRSKVGVERMDGAFAITDGARRSDVNFAEEGIVVETRAKPAESGEGVDVAIAEAFRSVSETASGTPSSGQGEPTQMNYGISGTVAGATVSGLRAREIGELWKSVVAHFDAGELAPETRARLLAALPLWDVLRAHAEIRDLSVETPQGAARMKTLGETLDLTGFTKTGAVEIGLDVDGMTLKSELLPPGSGGFWPASLSLNLTATSEGWDRAARLALDDAHFLADGVLSAEAQDKIGGVLAAGNPRMVLKPGHFKIPTLDLRFEGEAGLESDEPTGHLKVSADSLDKTIDLLKEMATSEPGLTPAILGLV